jgi:hypothetical protein
MTYAEYKLLLDTAEDDLELIEEIEPYGFEDTRIGFLNTPYKDWIYTDET